MSNGNWIYVPGAGENSLSIKKAIDSPLLKVKPGVHSFQVTYELGAVSEGQFEWDGKEYATLFVPGAGESSEEGMPEAPQEGIFVAVPQDVDPATISVEAKIEGTESRRLSRPLRPAPKPSTDKDRVSETDLVFSSRNYDSIQDYPGRDKYCEFLELRTIQGVKVAHLMVYPVHYAPASQTVSICRRMTLTFSYGVPPGGCALPDAPSILGDMILFDKKFQGKAGKSGAGAGVQGALLKRSDIECDYLIIAGKDMADKVKPLLQRKPKSRAATLDVIEKEFPGSDQAPSSTIDPKLAERIKRRLSIRSFLDWAVKNWKTPPRFVVLAGDDDDRRPGGDDFIPTFNPQVKDDKYWYTSDHYYADLTSTQTPDVIVSRIPVSQPAVMQKVCRKLADYPKFCFPDAQWRKRVLLVAQNRTASGVHLYDFEKCLDAIAAMIKKDGRLKFIKRYEDAYSSRDSVIEEIEKGVLVVNYRGHGSNINWASRNGLRDLDIPKLHDSELPPGSKELTRLPFVLCICCSNAYIDHPDEDSFVETFLKECKCVAVIGASRISPNEANDDFNRYLWQAILHHNEKTPGGIFQRAKALLVQNHPNSQDHRKIVAMYMLLGDPSAEVIP